MINRIKVITVVGTRPEIIKLSRVIAALDDYTDHTIIHTGQNYDYELNQIFFEDLGIRKPDHFLEAAGNTATQTVATVMAKMDELLESIEKPDAMLILGDTNSCMAAYPAKRRKIPVFHMEAGNRCFDERVPEEINRRIIDHISDINLVYTDHARTHLLKEGLDPSRVIKTGSPMNEIFSHYKKQMATSNVLTDIDLKNRSFFLASLHREENVDKPERLRSLLTSLESLAKTYDKTVVFSVHPRTRKRLESLPEWIEDNTHIKFIKPLGFFEYNYLQQKSFCVISDSGTLTEEASLLEFSAVMLRQAHERPEGMDEAAVVMADPDTLLKAVEMVVKQSENKSSVLRPVTDYQQDNVSTKVVRIIMSYIGYVNRIVWRDYANNH